MSKIIKFPKKNKRQKINDVLVDRLNTDHDHVHLGRVPFTCPDCQQTSIFDFTNAIFRYISFYCSGCGHGYKITNPAFSTGLRIINGKKTTNK